MATDLVSSYRQGQLAVTRHQGQAQKKFLEDTEKIRKLPTKAGEMFGVIPRPEDPVVPTDETTTPTDPTVEPTGTTTDQTEETTEETTEDAVVDPNLIEAQQAQYVAELDDALSSLQQNIANNEGSLSSVHYDTESQILNQLNTMVTSDPPIINETDSKAIMTNLVQINNEEKELRKTIAEFDMNQFSNYNNEYNKGVILSYLDPNTPRAVVPVKDNNGVLVHPPQYEWQFYDQKNDRWFTTNDMQNLFENNKKDIDSEQKLHELKAFISDKATMGSDINPKEVNNRIANKVETILENGHLESLIHDNLHGRTFVQDVNDHPIFAQWERTQDTNIFGKEKRKQGLVEKQITADQLNQPYDANNPGQGGLGLDVTRLPTTGFQIEQGEMNWYDNLSRDDIARIKDAITNPKSPYFNEHVTKQLLQNYYRESFKQLYDQSKETGDQYTYTPKPVAPSPSTGGEEFDPNNITPTS